MSEPPCVIFGDSLTYFGKPHLSAIKPAWAIDGHRGREAQRLPYLLDNWKTTYGSLPNHLVIALGTNEDGATKQLYQDAVNRFPLKVPIVFVTCYRDPKVFGQERADKMAEISKWMNQIAQSRPDSTGVVPWRNRVINNPHLLWDGVHCTDEGEKVWANMVATKMDEINARAAAAF